MTAIKTGVPARRDMRHCTEFVATGFCYPGELVDNDGFFARARFTIAEEREELVRQTRMKTRTWCGPEENTLTMAIRAVDMALAAEPALRDEIDVVVVTSATTMPVFHAPQAEHPGMADLAPLVLQHLGRSDALGFDLKAVACTGFLRGLQVMDALLANANYRAGLLISTEQCSRFSIGADNRSSFCFILSDAAGAAVLRRGEPAPRTGIVDYIGHTEADKFALVTMLPGLDALFVGGARVGTATHEMLVACGRALLARNGLTAADVDWLLPMQSHAAVIDAMCQALEWPRDRLIWHGDTTGFSGSASIGACLAEQVRDRVVKKGDLVLSLGVGAGMNCGGALYYA